MDQVGGGMENETEDQILARAMEESLRYYKEFEVPRLSQVTKNPEVTEDDLEIIGGDDMDCWEEWDNEQIDNALKVEESLMHDIHPEENNSEIKKISLENNKTSAVFMNNYLYHEVRPKQTSISVGEVGNDGADGFDKEAGGIWIYPCNFPVRKYQLDIVHSALFDNTLVSLPTGLGKTFIAAVIMYNFYRWFPMGKIIFLAPTRPLVAQQIHACYEIMGIPKNDTLELTGSKNASERAKAWKEKRVFFATPQVAANDLATGACPGELVRCVVVDEAHRAAGNHAICQAIRGLLRLREQSPGSRFRILALSATPGRNIPSVSNVVTTLRISKLELRDEQSPDVAPYTHQRNAETVVVPIGPELAETRNKFLMVMDPFLDRLMDKRVLYCGQKSKINKFQILQARANFRSNPPQRMDYNQRGLIEGDFATCITLTHALGLLLTHGQRTFLNFIQGIIAGDRGTQIVKGRLANNIPLLSLLSDLKDKFGAANSMLQPAPDVSLSEGMAGATEGKNENNPFRTSHPKMDHLKEIIIEHFEKFEKNGDSTRIMVFCEYRDPVVEICNMLMRYWPLVRPMSFVGQATASVQVDPNVAGTSKGTRGFTQKQQLQAVRGFRDGGYNVLVSTCVGEEGLDIGEVDLIVCYDAPHASPLRLVQRMGRTGRKREGRVVTLVTQDWEEHKHKMGLHQKNTIVRSLMNSKMLANTLCRNNPRVLPPGTNPKCHMMPMIMPPEEEEEDKKTKKGKGKGGKGKNSSNAKKGKGKGKARAVADDGSADEDNGRVDENNEDEDKGDVDSEEAITKKGKTKGKGKGRKKTAESSPSKNPGKGIKEFFKNHRLKDNEPIFDAVEDDDFIGVNKPKAKSHAEVDEVGIVNEDVQILDLESAGLRHSIDRTNCILRSDLQDLENTVTSIFGENFCLCTKINTPLRCSVMATHFRLRCTTIDPPDLKTDMSLDFLTAEVILNFNAVEEAEKAGVWEMVDEFPLETITLPTKEYRHLNSSSKHLYDRTPINLRDSMVIDKVANSAKGIGKMTMKDTECKSAKNKSVQKNLTNNISEDMFCMQPQEENLLWNVFGKQNKKEISDDDIMLIEDDNDIINGNNTKGNVSSKSNVRHEPKSNRDIDETPEKIPISKTIQSVIDNNYPLDAFEVGSPHDSRESTPDYLPVPQIFVSKSSASSHTKIPIEKTVQNAVFNSPPNALEIRSSHGSRESTPDNLPIPQASLCLSPIIGRRKGNFAVTSSTPKVHRKNLFPTTAYVSSPIKQEKSISANFDLIPSDVEFSDHEEFSPINTKCLSPVRPADSPDKVVLPSQTSASKEIGNGVHNYAIPNFDLGWDDEFDSDATFIEFENERTHDFIVDKVRNEDNGGSSLVTKSNYKSEENQTKVTKSLTEKGKADDSSKSYVERSSELCSVTKKKAPFTIAKEKLLKRKPSDDADSHFYTETQMMDILADTEISMTNSEIKKEFKQKEELVEEHGSSKFYYKVQSQNRSSKNSSELRENVNRSPVIILKTERQEGRIEEVRLLEKEKKEAVSHEINFDIGDEAFLDVSADLFAEDDTENWLRASGELKEENQAINPSNGKKLTEEIRIEPLTFEKDEILGKNVAKKELRSSGIFKTDLKKISEQREETTPQKLNHIAPAVPIPGLAGLNVDLLVKTAPASSNKLSLSRKNSKKEEESVNLSTNNRHSSCLIKPSVIKKSTYVEKVRKADVNLQNFKNKTYESIDWIDEITSKKPNSVSHTDMEERSRNISQKVMELHNDSSPQHSYISSELSDFEDFEMTAIEKILDKCAKDIKGAKNEFEECSSENKDDISVEEKTDSKLKFPVIRDDLKERKKSSSSRDVAVIKPAKKFVVVTLSSDEEEVDRSDITLKKSSGNDENSFKEIEEDVNKLDWSEWEGDGDCEFKDHEASGSSDDFESLGNKKIQKKTPVFSSSKEISISSEEKPPVRLRRGPQSKKRCVFLESQAEESFCEPGVRKLSSDEEDDCGRGNSQYYDPSFINDGLPHSQEEEVDIHAKYLQSVRSPRNPKFKIPDLPAIISRKENPAESYAYNNEPESCYLNDSFCVDGEEEENGFEENAESSVDELEVLEAILSKKSKDKKSQKRKKKKEDSSEDEVVMLEVKHSKEKVKSKNKKDKRKRKRIIIHDSSDEEGEKFDPPAKKTSLERNVLSEGKAVNRDDPETSDKGKYKKQVKSFPGDSTERCYNTSNEDVNSRNVTKRQNSSDSRGLTERRTGDTAFMSSEVGKNSESVCKSTSDKKTYPDLLDEITSNWSGDLFDVWNLSDDESSGAKNENIPSHSSNKSIGINKDFVSNKESGVYNHQGKAVASLSKTKPSPDEAIFKLPVNHHIKTETKPFGLSKQDKLNSENELSVSSGSLLNSRVKVENSSKNPNQNSCAIAQEASTSSTKTCIVTPYVNSNDLSSTTSSKMLADMNTLILVSPTEACRATDIVSALRVIRKIQVVVFAAAGVSFIPYSLGRDLCLFRYSLSELGYGSKATEHLQAAHKLYRKISVIVEWGDESPIGQWPQKRSSNWTNSSAPTTLSSSACLALINFGMANINVLHSSGKNETATLIAEVARHHQRLEINSGMEPITLPQSFNQSDPKLKFYASLPGVNPVQALHLLQKFPKISTFLSKCSSARSIQSSTGLDMNKSLQLYKVLASVHVSDT